MAPLGLLSGAEASPAVTTPLAFPRLPPPAPSSFRSTAAPSADRAGPAALAASLVVFVASSTGDCAVGCRLAPGTTGGDANGSAAVFESSAAGTSCRVSSCLGISPGWSVTAHAACRQSDWIATDTTASKRPSGAVPSVHEPTRLEGGGLLYVHAGTRSTVRLLSAHPSPMRVTSSR